MIGVDEYTFSGPGLGTEKLLIENVGGGMYHILHEVEGVEEDCHRIHRDRLPQFLSELVGEIVEGRWS